jgi:biotin synthase
MELKAVLDKALHSGDLTREEIVYLLGLTDESDIKALIGVADQVRRECVGDGVYIRGLIEFSNICARNCNYCGLRSENENVRRYRMPIQEIIDTAVDVVNKGIGTIVLQSGEDPWFTAERMAEVVRGIKSRVDCAISSLRIEMAPGSSAYSRSRRLASFSAIARFAFDALNDARAASTLALEALTERRTDS